MKELIILALAGFGGVYVYNKYFGGSVVDQQAIDVGNTAQPSQQYPQKTAATQMSVSQRNDNVNQPWYGGAMNFAKQQSSLLGVNVQDLSSVSSSVSSLSSIWDDMDIGNWFSGGGDEYTLDDFAMNDTDSMSYDWTSLDGDTTSSGSSYDFSSVA